MTQKPQCPPRSSQHAPERAGDTGRRRLIAIAGGIAAILLAACADRPAATRATETQAPATPPVPPAATTLTTTQPSVPNAPEGLTDAVLPVAPPTPEETRTAWKEGVALYDARDYDTAVARLQIAAAGRPDDAGVHYLHGLALWKSGFLAEADAALVRASSLDAGSIRTWINLARVRMARGDASGALQAADQALTIDPASADVLHQRGRALESLGHGDEALAAYQQARAAAPDNGWIANSLGHLLLIRGRVEEAIPHLEAAGDRLPHVAFVRNNLGVAYERRGDLESAADEYRAAVENGDPDGKAAASLARLEPLVTPVVASAPGPEEQDTAVTDDGDEGSTQN